MVTVKIIIMEKRLEEFRKKKQLEIQRTPSSFTVPEKAKKPHFVYVWWKKVLEQIYANELFIKFCTKLSRIPVVGNASILKILLWLILFGLFVELEFGIVYVIISLFVIIYFNTSTTKRSKNKLSAYSVFNKDYEKIDGTFTAEQFEKELTHRR